MPLDMEAIVYTKAAERSLNEIALAGRRLPLRRIAVIGIRSVLRNFHVGGRPGKWLPTKGRKGKPLQDTGALKKSIHPEFLGGENLKITTRHPAAAFHQHGTGIWGSGRQEYMIQPKNKKALAWTGAGGGMFFSRGHLHPGVPPRPFIMWQREDIKAIERLLLRHLVKGKR